MKIGAETLSSPLFQKEVCFTAFYLSLLLTLVIRPLHFESYRFDAPDNATQSFQHPKAKRSAVTWVVSAGKNNYVTSIIRNEVADINSRSS